jgi:hypothetical protein
VLDNDDLPLEETRNWLIEHAHRHFGDIPPEEIAEHVLAMTQGADFPVRRAALEALQRRMNNVDNEGVHVVEVPKSGHLGPYMVARSAGFGLKRGKRGVREKRPYETVLQGVSPLRGQCTCPDFLKGSLGLCKHLLATLVHVYEKPKRFDVARKQQAHSNGQALPQLHWDPVIPLLGPADRLASLRWVGLASSSRVDKFLDGQCVDSEVLADPALRVAFLRWAVESTQKSGRTSPAIQADPAARALLEVELAFAERRVHFGHTAPRALAKLKGLRRHLYPYQDEGVRRFLEAGRLLLADDMGLGKTTQAIAACHALFHAGEIKYGLIVAPASLKSQWLREWQATTDVPVRMVDGSLAERMQAYRQTRRGFLIVNYELILRDFEHIVPWAHELVVIDEAQRIKNYATKSAVYVKALPAARRLALTGTPMENRLDELASILDWIDDRALAPKWRLPAWHIQYEGDGMKTRSGARNLDTLRERIRGCVLRRVRAEVLSQLPGRTDTRVPVAMTPEQLSEHNELNQPLATLAAKSARRPLMQAEFLQLMQLLSKQRMIANGLGQLRFDELWPSLMNRTPSRPLLDGLFAPKLDEFRNLIESLVIRQQRKVVVFSQWRRMLKLADWAISDILAQGKYRSLFFTGAESSKLRTQSIVEFHDEPWAAVLFLSDAGGVGLNLQRAANACINLELPWNPAVLEQRIGRIYRLGQKKPIDVFNLVAEPSIESRIAGIVGTKQALFKGVFDGTTNEVKFDISSGLAAEVRRILDLEIPVSPVVPASEDSLTDAPPEELESSLDDIGDTIASSQTDIASVVDQLTLPAPGFATTDISALLGSLRISTNAEGGLHIETPPGSASTMASLFEMMARVLRESGESASG